MCIIAITRGVNHLQDQGEIFFCKTQVKKCCSDVRNQITIIPKHSLDACTILILGVFTYNLGENPLGRSNKVTEIHEKFAQSTAPNNSNHPSRIQKGKQFKKLRYIYYHA